MIAHRRELPRLIAVAGAVAIVLAGNPLQAAERTPDVHELVAEAAARFGLPGYWLEAVMLVESARQPRAVSPRGALGLMQIMPRTWSALRLRYGLGADPFDPRDNIQAGAAYLRELFDRYGPSGFLAAYNAGPARYERALRRVQPLPPETIAYIARLQPIIAGSAFREPVQARARAVSRHDSGLFADGSRSVPGPTLALHQPSSVVATSLGPRFAAPLEPRAQGLFVGLNE